MMIGAAKTHTLSVLVEDKPGVLARVAALFSRRGFNIESLAVGPTEDPARSRITIRVDCSQHSVDQVQKQLYKLIDVLKVQELGATVPFKVEAAALFEHEVGGGVMIGVNRVTAALAIEKVAPASAGEVTVPARTCSLTSRRARASAVTGVVSASKSVGATYAPSVHTAKPMLTRPCSSKRASR